MKYSLRRNMETISNDALQDGLITLEQAEGASRLIGHGREVAKTCYVLNDTYRSVKQVREIENQLGIVSVSDYSDEYSNTTRTEETQNININVLPKTYKAKPWGTDHPDFDNKSNRVRFSDAEKQYLTNLVEQKKTDSIIPINIASVCWTIIHKSDDAVPIFHVRHILTAARLRSCLRALKFVQ